ncbi:nuclear movement domain-containing protein [Babesia ovata]|uniref:Nuclear movement domain-containing protein n=1 Tax=Babesia ovata TaxID=189622 RepID=A0A2H6KEH0_9APIC|nr:nuclear movement domain-containing protein [Babesia ovata]GBE61391.1 nuclear movement domain-containing protein [Babesia ovata]
MPIDYSKWDRLELSDSEEENKPRVIKLDRTQRVELGRDGYNIVSGTVNTGAPCEVATQYKFWKDHLKNGNVVVRSHAFSQDRYDICLLIAVREEARPGLEVEVTESHIRIIAKGVEIFSKEFFAKVKSDDDYVNWQIVRKYVDWNALESYCHNASLGASGADMVFTEFYEQMFVEVDLKKQNTIDECFLWWAKAFKDDVPSIRFESQGGTAFKESWNQAHEAFKQRVKSFQKVQL